MYGSSFRTETRRPRALSRRPMLAAVMPFPSEEVTPPVTKTYFAMGRASGGFSNATDSDPLESNRSLAGAGQPRTSRCAGDRRPPALVQGRSGSGAEGLAEVGDERRVAGVVVGQLGRSA